MGEKCFVIMPIGDQKFVSEDEIVTVSAEDLKERYTTLIREAILKARPELDVVRADEVSAPGTITGDIFARIIHSDFVVADLTFPNPNVFYEVGIRHVCRAGTILVRDKDGPTMPFDLSSQRYIEYENTLPGLANLVEDLQKKFESFEGNQDKSDNRFMEIIISENI